MFFLRVYRGSPHSGGSVLGGYPTKKRLFHGYCNIIRIVVVVLQIRPKFPHICYSVDYRKISSDGLAQLKFQMSYSAVQCVCPIIREIMRRTGRFQRNVSVNRRVSRSRFVFPEFLQESGPIFLVEAYICALSVYQCGGKAIPCNGVGYRQILEALGNRRPRFLWLHFDRDARGMQAAEQFVAGLCRNGRCGGDCGSFWGRIKIQMSD